MAEDSVQAARGDLLSTVFLSCGLRVPHYKLEDNYRLAQQCQASSGATDLFLMGFECSHPRREIVTVTAAEGGHRPEWRSYCCCLAKWKPCVYQITS